jgi:Phosphotransferase enzyme family
MTLGVRHETTEVTIHALRSLVDRMIRAVGGDPPPGLVMTYLRRKPGRGLVAVYRALDTSGNPVPPAFVWLSVDEAALRRNTVVVPEAATLALDPAASWPGVVRLPTGSISLVAFPDDPAMPALVQVCDVRPDSPVFASLQVGARVVLGDPSLVLRSAAATPLRYKPADRCVVRYRLVAENGAATGIIGKVYADVEKAGAVDALVRRIYDEQLGQAGREIAGVRVAGPLPPRPLGMVRELGLLLNEDVRAAPVPVVTGMEALAGRVPGPIRNGALRATGVALARLHAVSLGSARAPARPPSKEAGRAAERAARLAVFAPGVGARPEELAAGLRERLEVAQAETMVAAHGSFKPAQLLIRAEDDIVVTDFDQVCLADPALDLGYFLAYLRPPALWYRRRGARTWYDGAAAVFCSAYRQAAGELGLDMDGALARAPLYEAALIFKIASRRPNRLQSARVGELSAMLDEIEACLGRGPA